MCIWIVVLYCWGWVGVEGRVEIGWGEEFVLNDVVVPFNGRVLEKVVSGVLVILCNITMEDGHQTTKTCTDQAAQGAAVIIAYPPYNPQYPGKNYYFIVDPPVMAPMVELNNVDYLILVQQAVLSNWTLNVTVYPNSYNPWIEASNSIAFLFFQVLTSFLQLLCILGSLYTLLHTPLHPFPALSHIVLLLELSASLLRLLYFSLDPLFSRHILPYAWSTTLQTLPLPFSLAASLLIGLFWFGVIYQKGLKKDKQSGWIVENLRGPCYGMIGVLFVIEVVCDVVRVMQGLTVGFTEVFLKVNEVIVFLVMLGIFGFYIFTGFKLVETLKESQKKSKVILKIQKLLIALTIVVFIVIIICTFIISPLYDTILGYYGLWFLGNIALTILSFIHIAAFWPKNSKKDGKPASPLGSPKITENQVSELSPKMTENQVGDLVSV